MGKEPSPLTRYGRKALLLAYPDDRTMADREDAWQRAQLPERFADFVYPGGEVWGAWKPSPGRVRAR